MRRTLKYLLQHSPQKLIQIKNGNKRTSGYTMAEFAPTLLFAFVVIVFPMLAAGTIGTRYVLLTNAARLAAQSASRCQTFKIDLSPPTNIGAVTTALNVSKNSISGIGGGTITWISTDTYISVCPLGSTSFTTPGANTALTTPADPVNNSYNCMVKIHATVAPVFPGFNGMLTGIPGLNKSFDTYATGENFFENTGNLNQ
jgi:hypothetical protein